MRSNHLHQPIFAQPPQNVVLQTQPTSLRCAYHSGELTKRICTSMGCNKRVLLCSECVYEDPDHVKVHKDQIMPVSDYLLNLDNLHRMRQSSTHSKPLPQDIPPQIMDLARNDQQYVYKLQGQLNEERSKIEIDLGKMVSIFKQEIMQAQQLINQQIEYHYGHIMESLVNFKKAIDPKSLADDNPRQQIEYLLRSQQDYNVLQAQIRTIRDKTYQNGGGGSLDSASSIQRSKLLADKIKKSINNPPIYTQITKDIIDGFSQAVKVLINGLTQKFIESVSVPPTDDDITQQDIFSDFALSQDALSLKLPIRERLALSHQAQVLPTFHKDKLTCIKALDSPFLVSGSVDGLAMMWNIDNGELVTTFQGHKGPITALAGFKGKNENYLVSGSVDKNVILWDLEDENNTLVFKGHEESITCIISLEDEQHIASGGADRKIIVWDTLNGKINCVLPCNGSIYKLHKLKAGGGKHYFISCDHSQALNIFRIEYIQINRSKAGKTAQIALEKVILTPCLLHGLTSSINNPLMLMGSASDKSVKVWNFNFTGEGKFQSESIVKEFTGHKSGVAEAIVIDSLNSVQGNEDYYLLSCGINDERIILRHSKSQQVQYFSHQGLKINEVFTSHKMQVVRNSRNEYKLVVVNQSAENHQILLWDLNDTRII